MSTEGNADDSHNNFIDLMSDWSRMVEHQFLIGVPVFCLDISDDVMILSWADESESWEIYKTEKNTLNSGDLIVRLRICRFEKYIIKRGPSERAKFRITQDCDKAENPNVYRRLLTRLALWYLGGKALEKVITAPEDIFECCLHIVTDNGDDIDILFKSKGTREAFIFATTTALERARFKYGLFAKTYLLIIANLAGGSPPLEGVLELEENSLKGPGDAMYTIPISTRYGSVATRANSARHGFTKLQTVALRDRRISFLRAQKQPPVAYSRNN